MRYHAVKEGGELQVADITCWNCNQEYISINDDIYPYGQCLNCGEYNEIKKCGRCNSLYDSDEGDDFLCGYCNHKIESE
jgi:DNA-directed RNA polymerase subunit RPC12/RpoP